MRYTCKPIGLKHCILDDELAVSKVLAKSTPTSIWPVNQYRIAFQLNLVNIGPSIPANTSGVFHVRLFLSADELLDGQDLELTVRHQGQEHVYTSSISSEELVTTPLLEGE